MNLVDLFLKPWVVDKKYLMPSLIHPACIENREEHKFIDYVSNLPKKKFVYEDVDVLRLEDLFAKLKSIKPEKAAKVYFWDQGVVFAGFGDLEGTAIGNVLSINATSLDESVKLLFKKGGVRVIFHDCNRTPELYKPKVIREGVGVLDNPSKYLEGLKEEINPEKKRTERLLEIFRGINLDVIK